MRKRLVQITLITIFMATTFAVSAAERFDVVLKNGRVVDGTGSPWYTADIGIRNGKIARIGRIDAKSADIVIDVAGLIVAPGFIDMMGQTATPMLENPTSALNLLTQGITTINAGEGVSAAPVSSQTTRETGWGTMAEYFQLIELKGLPLNVVQTVGHTQVRRLVLGEVDRRPTEKELYQMRALVAEAMQAGTIGLSTALIYPPAVYASTEEIAALAAVAGQYGGSYYTHMRNEGDRLLEAIDEALQIGRIGKTPVHIFHLKAAGRQNWGKMVQAIARIRAARAAGHDVTADIYPYINNGLGIAAFIHPRHFAKGRGRLWSQLADPQLRKEIRREMESEGGWENWFRHTGNNWNKVILGSIGHSDYAKFAGQSLAEIAKSKNEDPWDTFFTLASTNTFVLPESMTEANKILLIQQNFISFCTDVGPSGGSRISSHPRAFGAFPRLMSRYVRDLGAISLERAVAQATANAANAIMAYDRGRIAEGMAADLIAFDYERLADQATFAKPHQLSQGIKYVLVNGELVLRDGKMTGSRPGRVLRGPGYSVARASAAVTEGSLDPHLESIDAFMKSFVEKHQVPGVAVAVTDQSRLVFARGYGYSDIAKRQPVKPTSLFRIASISKPITAAAILQLVEQGKLKLDDPIFDHLKYKPHLEDGAAFDERQNKITIRHLLQHQGGWDRNKSFDAMFQSVRFAKSLNVAPPASAEHVIRCMLGQRLDFEPGNRYAYSNFGYCLLGRVIEKLSGQTYESYVQKHVLQPLSIRTMKIGKTRLEDRQPLEVRYYSPGWGESVFAEDLGKRVPRQYGAWHLEAMDSHGAWIASAVDLARFACAFDRPTKSPILKEDSIKTMFDRPSGLAGFDSKGQPNATYYSLGWMNRPTSDGNSNNWHTGSLSGTAALIVRRSNGRNIVVLFNARSSRHTRHFGQEIDRHINPVIDRVKTWPSADLFDKFQ